MQDYEGSLYTTQKKWGIHCKGRGKPGGAFKQRCAIVEFTFLIIRRSDLSSNKTGSIK